MRRILSLKFTQLFSKMLAGCQTNADVFPVSQHCFQHELYSSGQRLQDVCVITSVTNVPNYVTFNFRFLRSLLLEDSILLGCLTEFLTV